MIDMHLLALIGNRSKRAVSPVVSTILLIALTTASIGGVAVIMANINAEGLPTANTDNASIGAASTVSLDEDISVDISIAKLSYNLFIFADEGKKYYTSITIQVDYTGTIFNPNYIYVIDFDIFVYGQKLDEVSPWEVQFATGASPVFDADDNFQGFEQAKGSSATYVVEVKDPYNQESRIFEESSFQYQAKIGLEAGVITHQFVQEEVSKVQFNNVYYNIAIIHFDQVASDPNSGIAYWLDALDYQNGSNNLFLLFDENNDLYDINSGVLSTLNLTAFAENYDVVIFAEWGIHVDAVTFATYMHNNSMPMLFAGTVYDITLSIDDTAQNLITGVTPHMHTKQERFSFNYYKFNSSTDYLLLGLSGQGEDPYLDEYGYDAAYLTGANITQYGEAHIELYNPGMQLTFNHTGPLLVRKEAVLDGTGLTITYIINHALATHSQTVYRNMIFSAFHDEDRILTSEASMTIDSWVKTVAGNYRGFNIEIRTTVIDGDIKANTLTFSLKMDKDIKWQGTSYDASLSVAGYLIENVAYTIAEGVSFDLITIDIGLEYGLDIPEGSEIIINLPQSGDMSVNRDTNLPSGYIWINSFEWLSLDDSFGTVSQTNS